MKGEYINMNNNLIKKDSKTYYEYILNEFSTILNDKYEIYEDFACIKIHQNNNIYLIFNQNNKYYLSEFQYDIFKLCIQKKKLKDIIYVMKEKYSKILDKESILENVFAHICFLKNKNLIKKLIRFLFLIYIY